MKLKISSFRNNLKNLLGFMVLLLASLFIFQANSTASAATNYLYPDDGVANHYVSSSRVGNGIQLEAPYAYLKARFDPETYFFDFRIDNGCYWNNVDGGTSKPNTCRSGDVTFWFCPSDANGNFDSTYKSNGRCYTTDPATWPNGAGVQEHRFCNGNCGGLGWPLTIPTGPNGQKNIFVIASMNIAGGNGFRIRSIARNSAGAEVAGLDTRIGLGGQLTMPLSLVKLPLTDGGSGTYTVRFKVPCAPARNSFQIGWFDADRPPTGIPDDPDINWRMYNDSTGGNYITSSQLAFISGQSENDYLGGNNQDRLVTLGNINVPPIVLRVQAGDNYRFNWLNVDDNNGIQIKIPFDEADSDLPCEPTPVVDTGTCTVTSTPRIIYPNTTFSAGFTVENTGDTNWGTGARPQVSSYSGRYVLRSEEAANNTTWGKSIVELPGNVTYGDAGNAPFGPIMFPGDKHTFTESGFSTPSSPGEYVFSWSIRRLDQQNRVVSENCRVTIYVVERKPYWRVYGGDVYSGFGFVPPNGGSCPASAGGRFRGYNISLLGVRIGAGAQLAAYALNPIDGFSTASTRTSSPLPPRGLTFANDNNAQTFGGDWDANNFNCAADYFDPDASAQADGYIVSGRTLGLGQKQTIYVDGDAYISGNIYYPAYASLSQLPSFKLIVKGNIYVNPNVTELNGWFIAQPRYDNAGNMLATTGRFYTCAITGRVNPVPTNAEIATVCNEKLTVYGAILAHTLKPIRSKGDLRSAVVREGYTSSNLAESFMFSPEVWLTGGGTNSGSYDSITALPPIL